MPYRESPVSTVHASATHAQGTTRPITHTIVPPSRHRLHIQPSYTLCRHAHHHPSLTLLFLSVLFTNTNRQYTPRPTLHTNRQPTPRCRNTDAISSTLFAAVAAFAWPEAGGAASGMQRLVCAYGLAFFAVDLFPTLLTGDALAIVHHVIAIGGYAKVLFSPASDSQVKRVYCTPFNHS